MTEFKLATCDNNHMCHVRSEYLKSQKKLNCNRLYGKYLMLMYFMESYQVAAKDHMFERVK